MLGLRFRGGEGSEEVSVFRGVLGSVLRAGLPEPLTQQAANL